MHVHVEREGQLANNDLVVGVVVIASPRFVHLPFPFVHRHQLVHVGRRQIRSVPWQAALLRCVVELQPSSRSDGTRKNTLKVYVLA